MYIGMENKNGCTYWDELKEKKIKISLNTKDHKFFTGYILNCTETGIIFIDKFDEEIFLNFDNINLVRPFTERGIKRG